jgi:hypothetical protein
MHRYLHPLALPPRERVFQRNADALEEQAKLHASVVLEVMRLRRHPATSTSNRAFRHNMQALPGDMQKQLHGCMKI